MNTILVFALVVLAATNAAILPSSTRANLIVGYVSTGDRLLYRSYVYQPARPNTIQYQDIVYRGNATTRITAIQATEVGATQYASAWILSGGLSQNNVTVRFQSARGYGYYYLFDVWGR
ncbi:uncharacterized protein LOC101738476 isoform X2 [Bombyx mori]|uniref:Salivary secreted peptide n=2 Tax=Bombyx mori TaxID=7091 RepID=A0A8R2M418_BOMMO|nr:uncharacterized protein LOC101738476 [Bombyx mori]XP_037874076.1 uncharacterized protein LOC101738476 [Bombyx mori]